MASVWLYDTQHERYRVIHSYGRTRTLDDCEFSVVEHVLVGDDASSGYFLCLSHQLTDCKCVREVLAQRGSIGLGDKPADEGW